MSFSYTHQGAGGDKLWCEVSHQKSFKNQNGGEQTPGAPLGERTLLLSGGKKKEVLVIPDFNWLLLRWFVVCKMKKPLPFKWW